MHKNRLNDVNRLYDLLGKLENRLGGMRELRNCNGKMHWPRRGVYFFFEPGECRSIQNNRLRVVRVGTHALKIDGHQRLWDRLRTHQGHLGGNHPGGGNHRGSIFRKHIGYALINRDNWGPPISETWGRGNHAPKFVREVEFPLEKEVSSYIGKMPFLWIEIDDQPGPDCKRAYAERNAIALLSNGLNQSQPIDPPSEKWLGRWTKSEEIKSSGLWNVKHVFEDYDPLFLDYCESIL